MKKRWMTWRGLVALIACLLGQLSPAAYVNDWSSGGITWNLAANETPADAHEFGHESSLKVWISGAKFNKGFNEETGIVAIPDTGVWYSHGDGQYISDRVPDYTVYFSYLAANVFSKSQKVKRVIVGNTPIRKPCFLGCSNLKAFAWSVSPSGYETGDENRGVWTLSAHTTSNGVLFDGGMTELFKYPEGKDGDSYTVPATVKTLGQYCLANTKLKVVHFRGDAPAIEPTDKSETVFSGSSQLEKITYPRGAKGWTNPWCGRRAVMELDKPVVCVSNGYDGVHLSWNAVDGATAYRVAWSSTEDMKDSIVSWTAGLGFRDREDFYPGTKRYYRVMANNADLSSSVLDGSAESEWSSVVSGSRLVGRLKLIFDESGTCVSSYEYGAPDNKDDRGAWVDGVLTIPESVVRTSLSLSWVDGPLVRKLVLPDGLKEISNTAFGMCSSLESVEGGRGLENVSENAFGGTPLVSREADGFELVYLGSCVIGCRGRLDEDEFGSDGYELTFREGTTCVVGLNGLSMTSIVFPLSLTDLGDFSWCYNLKRAVFNGLAGESLKGWCLPDDCEIVCRGTMKLDVEDGVVTGWYLTTLPDGDLKDGVLTVPDGVTNVADAVTGSTHMPICLEPPDILKTVREIRLPDSLISIGVHAFYGYSGLTSVVIPESVTSIGLEAFADTPFYDNQPDGMVILGRVLYAYKGECPSSPAIPSNVTSIGDFAFYDCSGLTSVTIPSSVTSIGRGALADCSSLTSVTISLTVTSIGDFAFYGCDSLATVYADKGDIDRVKGLYDWPKDVRFEEKQDGGVVTTYTLTFDANGATGVMEPLMYEAGRVYKLPKCGFKMPEGKTRFVGWAGSNGRRYDDEMLVFDLGDVTMTAIWE